MSESFVLEDARRAARARAQGQRAFVKSFGCQMNVYDSAAHGRRRGRGRLPRGAQRSRTPISSSSTPAISANARRRRSIPNSASCANSRTNARRAGQGRRSSSPAASPRPRARKSCAASRRSMSSSARRAITACRELLRDARLGAASSTPISRSRTSSTICPQAARGDSRARRHRLRHRAGGLRQVLLVLRRALYARRRGLAPVGAVIDEIERLARRRRARGHADRPERQRLSRRLTATAARSASPR